MKITNINELPVNLDANDAGMTFEMDVTMTYKWDGQRYIVDRKTNGDCEGRHRISVDTVMKFIDKWSMPFRINLHTKDK